MTLRRRAAVLVTAGCLLVALATAFPQVSSAASVSGAQLRSLSASAAAGDPGAWAELRAVTAVDGRPADLASLLGSGTPQELRARLLALSTAVGQGGTQSTAAASAAGAQAAAAAILSRGQYKATASNVLVTLLRRLARAVNDIASLTPGGGAFFWVLAAAIVLVATVFLVRRTLTRRQAQPAAMTDARRGAIETAQALEREAAAAEQRGAFGQAIRLRFRAGLLTLGDRATIDYRPSLLTAEVARRLRSPQFDSLTDAFEQVAYGGAGAGPDDAAAAREGWKKLLRGER
jgi:hypothetical protein